MAHNAEKVLTALRKARSLTDKVLKMMAEDKYCIDVIQQNLAIIGLLKSANLSLLEGHVNHCVRDAASGKSKRNLDSMTSELLKVINVAQHK